MKILVALLPALPLAACAEASAAPEPDPAEVERVLARVERQGAAPPEIEEAQDKVRKADRLVGTLERTDPDRFTRVAERLLAR